MPNKYHFYAVLKDGDVHIGKHYSDGTYSMPIGWITFDGLEDNNIKTKEQFIKRLNGGNDGRTCNERPFDCTETV